MCVCVLRKPLTESGADEEFGNALRIVVLLVFKEFTGDHLLLHLFRERDGEGKVEKERQVYLYSTFQRKAIQGALRFRSSQSCRYSADSPFPLLRVFP